MNDKEAAKFFFFDLKKNLFFQKKSIFHFFSWFDFKHHIVVKKIFNPPKPL